MADFLSNKCFETLSDGRVLKIKLLNTDSMECVKLPMPDHQVLLLTGHIFKASFIMLVTWVVNILSMFQSELGSEQESAL